MSMLQVRGADYSVTKQKAFEDAKKMQVAVAEECIRAGKEPPLYHLQELIGKGSFGRVYKATDIKTSRLVAVKIIDIEESDTLNPKLADTYSEFLKEINALKLLSEGGAKNVNLFLDALPVGQTMWMITEYCAGGSVATLMKPTAPGGLQERWIIPILRETAEAIYWVHRAGIIHRDIKCANVLVTEAGGVQLCDFGVAGVIETKFDKRSTFIGTPHWMAPELFDQNSSYGTEVDIWAFGAMVYEIASGLPPNVFSGVDVSQLGNYIKQHAPRLEDEHKYSSELRDLVAFCLEEDPSIRPIIEDLQRHPYISGTSANYPTATLAALVKGYRLWETQGGSRKSLFAPGGAQVAQTDLTSTALAADEWNFSATMELDRTLLDLPDAQAVYDAYGSQVDYNVEPLRPSKPKGRRRQPPPQLPAVKAPLENIFDPQNDSDYTENSRAFYGMAPPPPTSDLPLRDNSLHNTLRESLIDLDASTLGLDDDDVSRFVDMETIRAGPRPLADDPTIEAHDFGKAPLSDPADKYNNRRTQDWKFPSMAAPLSANPEMEHFTFNDDLPTLITPSMTPTMTPGSGGRPPLVHHPTDPMGLQSQAYDTMVPGRMGDNRASMSSLIDLDESVVDSVPLTLPAQMPDNRASMNSLIDLDMSLPDPPELTRPSTANSDTGSVTGSEIGGANPFDLERHASLYQPLNGMSNREPSIYVSDDSDFAKLAQVHDGGMNGDSLQAPDERSQRRAIESYLNDTGMYSGDEYMENEYMNNIRRSRQSRHEPQGSGTSGLSQSFSDESSTGTVGGLPPLPEGPSPAVLQGISGRQEVRDELQRMLASFNEHLSFAGEHVATLPVRRGRAEQAVED